MSSITSKLLQVSPGISYKYSHSKASQPNLPTVLLLHGFPSSAADFRPQMQYLAARGYGVLAPDLLGYGGTTKPGGPRAYVWREMSAHVAAILNAEGLGDSDSASASGTGKAAMVVGVGHDLGSWFLSRLYHFYPSRFAGLAFLGVGYVAPGDKFDVEMINRMSREMTGEERFRYWDVFAGEGEEGKESVALMDRHVESVVSLMHASPEVMAANLGPAGRAREWISSGRVAPTHYSGEEENRSSNSDSSSSSSSSAYFAGKIAMFREGGFTGPTNWYKALRWNLSFEDEREMSRELEVPVLVVGCGRDEMSLAGVQDQVTKPWARAGYRFEVLDAGHWIMLEDAEGTNRLLEDFLMSIS